MWKKLSCGGGGGGGGYMQRQEKRDKLQAMYSGPQVCAAAYFNRAQKFQ